MSAAIETVASIPGNRAWPMRPLGKIAKFLGGGTPSKRRDDFWDGDIPWVSPKDMKLDVVAESIDKITSAAVDGSAVRLIPAGALLVVVRSGILARTVPTALAGVTLTINQDLKAIVPSAALDPHFLAHFMRSVESHLLGLVSRGATVHRLETNVLKSLAIPLPPLEEQKRIVAVLDQAFAALDRARANAEANLADANLLYASTVDELMQRHRSGWQSGTVDELVGEVATGPFGSLLHKSDYVEAGIPIVNPSNIVNGVIEPDWSKTVSAEAAERLQSYRLHEGDLVVGRRGEMGRCAFVPADVDGWLCGTGSFFIRTRSGVSPEFVAYLMRSSTVVDTLTAISTGATMPNLSNRALAEMALALPDLETQLAILARVKRIESKTKELCSGFNAKVADLADLRQSLLQQAFAGELT